MRNWFDSPYRRWARATVTVISIAAASLVLSAQTTQLRLVSTAWSPFTNAAGQPRFALDLVEAALKRIDINASTTIVPAAQFTPALMTGRYDGSAAAWKDAEREGVLLFSQPYLQNRLILVGRKGADVTASKLSALAGKRLAIVEGYAYGDIGAAGPVFVPSKSEEDSLTQLLQSKADYALMDELVVQYLVANYPKETQTRLQLGTSAVMTRPLYFAVRRSRIDAESIIRRFDAQLRGMIADRTYHKLLHVGWILADVDGDGVPEYVPASDKAGTNSPQHVYSLIQADPSKTTNTTLKVNERFYLGGNIYSDWAAVPSRFKVEDSQQPNSARSTGSIFKFVW